MSFAACTIASPNYLHFARTLAASFVAQHPEQRFFVLIVADLTDPAPFRFDPHFTPVMLGELGLADLRVEAMKYDILELNTNVKPSFMKHLMAKYKLDGLVYLDPDILVYAPLAPVFDALGEGATAVLTPHMTTPIFDGCLPGEQDLLYNGTYNLGFIGIGNTPEGGRLLDWWEHRCLALGFSEGRTGLFVDQKWINLVPGLFDRVVISRDAGLNMAYWNLHERALIGGERGPRVESPVSGDVPLRFFHFSGIELEAADVLSRHTDRFTLAERPDLKQIFAEYKAKVLANRTPVAEALPYGFDHFSDGITVTRLARRLFAAHLSRFTNKGGNSPDPFQAAGAFARFAQTQGLVKGTVAPAKSTWKQFDPADRRVKAVHRLLRWVLRVLGPHRYELLMRYLAFISVLRHQGAFLRDPRWVERSDAPDTHAAE
ncbi:MAG: hypothetical protein ACRYFU_10690 [Janthinobacterium lividum]